MKKITRVIVFVLGLTLTNPFTTLAWHANGHSTAGAVAYYYLQKNNPMVLAKVLATLKLHYWYNTPHWQTRLAELPVGQQDVGLFMLASTYPDDAKQDHGNPDGDPTHKEWHFTDFPVVVPGSGVTGAPPKTPNSQQMIARLISSISNEPASPQKAKDIAWLFHLIEDIHQPLHCASLFNAQFPNGDRGGNDNKVKARVKTDLHSYWDDLVGGKNFISWPGFARQLVAMPKYQESQLSELVANKTPNDWMLKESFPDAQTIVYRNGKISGSLAQPALLDANYQSAASTLAERRVVLSGIRLAKLMINFYGGATPARNKSTRPKVS